jgi:hypothetical protein
MSENPQDKELKDLILSNAKAIQALTENDTEAKKERARLDQIMSDLAQWEKVPKLGDLGANLGADLGARSSQGIQLLSNPHLDNSLHLNSNSLSFLVQRLNHPFRKINIHGNTFFR